MQAGAVDAAAPEVREATADEGWNILSEAAWRMLGMSGQEFLVAWDRGDFVHETERHEVSAVAMLIPFVR